MSQVEWDKYFLDIVDVVTTRSSCSRRQVGAVLVSRNLTIISTGYNGTPRNTTNCNEGGCARCNALIGEGGTNLDTCMCVHAEENAILNAAYHGVATNLSRLYTNYFPCLMCAKSIINAGILQVIYRQEYPGSEAAHRLLTDAGVGVYQHAVRQ